MVALKLFSSLAVDFNLHLSALERLIRKVTVQYVEDAFSNLESVLDLEGLVYALNEHLSLIVELTPRSWVDGRPV